MAVRDRQQVVLVKVLPLLRQLLGIVQEDEVSSKNASCLGVKGPASTQMSVSSTSDSGTMRCGNMRNQPFTSPLDAKRPACGAVVAREVQAVGWHHRPDLLPGLMQLFLWVEAIATWLRDRPSPSPTPFASRSGSKSSSAPFTSRSPRASTTRWNRKGRLAKLSAERIPAMAFRPKAGDPTEATWASHSLPERLSRHGQVQRRALCRHLNRLAALVKQLPPALRGCPEELPGLRVTTPWL